MEARFATHKCKSLLCFRSGGSYIHWYTGKASTLPITTVFHGQASETLARLDLLKCILSLITPSSIRAISVAHEYINSPVCSPWTTSSLKNHNASQIFPTVERPPLRVFVPQPLPTRQTFPRGTACLQSLSLLFFQDDISSVTSGQCCRLLRLPD